MERHVYGNQATDWYVASSPEEAALLCRAAEIINETGITDDELDLEFHQYPDENTLTIDLDDGKGPQAKTCREWAAQSRKGFLATTNF